MTIVVESNNLLINLDIKIITLWVSVICQESNLKLLNYNVIIMIIDFVNFTILLLVTYNLNETKLHAITVANIRHFGIQFINCVLQLVLNRYLHRYFQIRQL